MTSPQRLVVIGNGMVGQRFLDEMVRLGSKNWEITAIGAESIPAYDRVRLSSYFDGAELSDLDLCDQEALSTAGIDLRLGVPVAAIDRPRRTVVLDDGSELPYDHVVLATGSAPFVPPIPGNDAPGCFVYRTIDDLDAIRAWSESDEVKVGAVVGGGLLGLECANALKNLGLETHVVEMADRLMPQQLGPDSSGMLARWIEELDIELHLGYATDHLGVDSDGHVCGLESDAAGSVGAQIVVFSAGIRPRDQLARDAGLDVGERGGVVIDQHCRTSDPNISAIGEVASHQGQCYGLVGPGYTMATVVAEKLHGHDASFDGADLSTKLKLLGVDVGSFGDHRAGTEYTTFSDATTKIHRLVALRDGVVVGGTLVGDVSNFEMLHAMATDALPTADVTRLVLPAGLGAAATTELPDTAQLCSCNNVLIGDAKEAVAQGCHDMAALAGATRAGTGCGGCVPDVKRLLDRELVVLGIGANRALCAHFDHTRQELFDLVRFHRHQTWTDVLRAHGTGRGCEICRPTIGSILASLANGYVLDGDQGSIQDTNDHSLANMQRNGTYSVVPRVPGGEITPQQLIALGEIGKEYDLYTKITGAQRIDLFGAQLHELPEIWEKVINAGLESGHAYGKALRTVKSCVGETWCRYGVQDSVSMAIRLEKRYRGLRSPHKLKSAVSGCTRECAEAQSKDFGVIATETGWNLYLAGNGGRTPRHAELFAVDLSDDELIRYIDRFLMFYIRTADRLERTAPWFAKLDGGMDYLRQVIVDDVLGICTELEADMDRHVETYECEWTATLNNPDRLANFIEFVNAPDATSTPVWISERGQRVPAPIGAGT